MRLLLIVFLAAGFPVGGLILRKPGPPLTATDWLGVIAFQVPAMLLVAVGIWQAKKRGKFFGVDLRLFMISAAVMYLFGVWVGYYMEH